MTAIQKFVLEKFVRLAGLEPEDLNLERIEARAQELYDRGESPIVAYGGALGVDFSLPSYAKFVAYPPKPPLWHFVGA